MGKWFFPSCLLAFATQLLDKEKAHTLNFHETCHKKSHFLFTSHNECVFNMGEKMDWEEREGLEPVGGEVLPAQA